MEQLRPPARLARRRGRAARAPRRRGRRARSARLARRPARRARDAGRGRSPATRCRTWTTSRAASASRRRAAPDDAVRGGRGAIDALLPGDGPLADRLAAWDAALEIPVDRLPAVVDWLVERFRDARGAGCSACPTARTCASRWSATSRGPATTGTTAAAARGSTSTPTSRSGPPDLVARRSAHETYPGPPPRARLEGGRPRRPRWAGSRRSILLINTPECLISEGLADVGRRRSRSPPTSAPTCWSSCSSGRGCRSRRTRSRPREAAERAGRHRRARARSSASVARQRRAPAPRRRRGRTTRSLAYLVEVGRLRAGVAPRSGSSSSSTRCGGPTSSSTPRARRCCGAGSRRCPRRTARPGSRACSTSS